LNIKNCFHKFVTGACGMGDGYCCEKCGLRVYPEKLKFHALYKITGRIRNLKPNERFFREYPYVREVKDIIKEICDEHKISKTATRKINILKNFYKDVRHLYFNSTHNDLSIEVLECLLDEIGKLIETAHKQGLNSNE